MTRRRQQPSTDRTDDRPTYTPGEAEAARMHAKAGGPTNYRDAELLERYGCRDKTDSDYCWYLYKKQRGHFRHAHRNGKKYRRY